MTQKKPTEAQIKEKVKEFLQEFLSHSMQQLLNMKNCGIYPHLRCPVPDCCGRMYYVNGKYRCEWRGCGYVIPEEFAPPSPTELEEFHKEKARQVAFEKTKQRILEIQKY